MKYLLPLIFFYSVALGQQLPTGPLQFVKDKKTTNVLQDTVTPANNTGLPVNVVAGSLSATNPSVGTNGAAIPTSSTQVAGSDGTNLVPVKVSATGVMSVDGSATTQPVSGSVSVSNFPVTQPVSGTVTANQGTSPWVVNGSGFTQPVSGTFWQATQPVSASSLPLPSGAATDSSLGTINTTLGSPFQAGGSIGNTSFGIAGTLPAFTATPTFNLGTIGGAATESTLSTIDGKFGTLGQKAMTGSAPVVIASDQSSIPVTGTFYQATQPVSISTTVPTSEVVGSTGSGSGASETISTALTLTAPANTKGFILMNMDTSTANIRWTLNRSTSPTLGQQLQPGRDTGFIPYSGNVRIVAESGTQTYDLQWISN